MIILLDTSTPVCRLIFIDDDFRMQDEWQADRTLAKGLLGYLQTQLEAHGKSWADIAGIGVFRGPGSFTGLRIGLTVLNTIADAMNIPIVGATGEGWQAEALSKLREGGDDRVVLPEYGGEAHITKPRK